jgi:monoamine oxidase
MYHISGTNSGKILYREYSKILPYVLNNTAISAIDYSGNKVKVRDQYQVLREYDYVVVTVPISILKLQNNDVNSIKFLPALPESKIAAMNKIGMDGAIKIALKTNRKFWHEDSKAIYTKGQIGKYEIVSEDPSNNSYILTATVMGAYAENVLNGFDQLSLSEDYSLDIFPKYFLIDADGDILQNKLCSPIDGIEEIIKQYLKK